MNDGDCDIDCPDCGDCDCDCDCNCLFCCCCYDAGSSAGYGTSDTKRRSRRCLLTILFLLFVVTVLVLIFVFAFAIVLPVRVAVEDASLARLALAGPNGTALAYNMSFAVAVCNPNWAMNAGLGDPLDVGLLFAGERFITIRMMQHGSIQPGNMMVYKVAAAGESATPLGSAGVAEFVKESAAGGVFRLELKLAVEVRYQTHGGARKVAAICPLELPLPSSAAAPATFKKIKCVM